MSNASLTICLHSKCHQLYNSLAMCKGITVVGYLKKEFKVASGDASQISQKFAIATVQHTV